MLQGKNFMANFNENEHLIYVNVTKNVWFKLLSSRTSFQLEDEFRTPQNLNSEVSTPKILLFSSWYFM